MLSSVFYITHQKLSSGQCVESNYKHASPRISSAKLMDNKLSINKGCSNAADESDTVETNTERKIIQSTRGFSLSTGREFHMGESQSQELGDLRVVTTLTGNHRPL